jgi:hypothetical protein
MTDNDSTKATDTDTNRNNYNLPTWVSGGLATKRDVCIDATAQQELRNIMFDENDAALEFYGRNAGESSQTGYEHVRKCIEEVLAMDVRSAWQTKKARQGKSQADRAARLQQHVGVSSKDVPATVPFTDTDTRANESVGTLQCTQQIDNLLIHYTIEEATETALKRPATSQGSGAEDKLIVTQIQLLKKSRNKNNKRGGG